MESDIPELFMGDILALPQHTSYSDKVNYVISYHVAAMRPGLTTLILMISLPGLAGCVQPSPLSSRTSQWMGTFASPLPRIGPVGRLVGDPRAGSAVIS